MEKLYRISSACKILAIGRTKFYNLVSGGKLDLHKIGSASRISESSLQTYIASTKKEAGR